MVEQPLLPYDPPACAEDLRERLRQQALQILQLLAHPPSAGALLRQSPPTCDNIDLYRQVVSLILHITTSPFYVGGTYYYYYHCYSSSCRCCC